MEVGSLLTFPQLFLEPWVWTTPFLAGLFAALGMMLFGKIQGRTEEEMWVFRGAGIEVAFVLLPFVCYAIGSILNGSYSKFMASPELPMAAVILAGMVILSVHRGIAASQNRIATEAFLVFSLVAIFVLSGLCIYVGWLAYSSNVSLWFGVLNSALILAAVVAAFGVHSVMAYVVKYPERFGRKEEDEELS